MSEQRFHEVRVRFQYERQRHGFYRAAVVFSCRRARRAVRFAAQDAFVAAFDRWAAPPQRVAASLETRQALRQTRGQHDIGVVIFGFERQSAGASRVTSSSRSISETCCLATTYACK